jgi:hypothetical protein
MQLRSARLFPTNTNSTDDNFRHDVVYMGAEFEVELLAIGANNKPGFTPSSGGGWCVMQ